MLNVPDSMLSSTREHDVCNSPIGLCPSRAWSLGQSHRHGTMRVCSRHGTMRVCIPDSMLEYMGLFQDHGAWDSPIGLCPSALDSMLSSTRCLFILEQESGNDPCLCVCCARVCTCARVRVLCFAAHVYMYISMYRYFYTYICTEPRTHTHTHTHTHTLYIYA